MARVIFITEIAEYRLDIILDYLEKKWSLKSKKEFTKKLDKSISIIKSFPESFPESSKSKGLRKCVITKQTSLYYRFDKEKVYVITIFDSRQDLNTLWQDAN